MSPRARVGVVVALLGFGCGDASEQPLPSEPRSDDATHESDLHDFTVTTVVEGLEHPWGMVFLPDGDILVTERPGRLRIVRDGALLPDPVSGLPDAESGGQGGQLDVALHPRFSTSRMVYLTYAKRRGNGDRTTMVARGRLVDDALEDVEEIFEADAWTGHDEHFGSRLAFDADGYLYVSIGERGERDEAQDLSNHQGTITRLSEDGGVPSDNPFLGDEDALPEIWAYGIRNAQGLAFHPGTGALWASEHGPLGGDEINVIRSGRNYGWPEVTYGLDYDGSRISDRTEEEGMERPVHHWEQDSPATSGLAFYQGAAFPAWQGDAFVGGLSGRQLVRLDIENEEVLHTEILLRELGHRIRDVREGPDGFLYLLVDDERAPMLRLEPVGP